MAKYGMSLCVLGMAEELQPEGIAVNALWPKTGEFILATKLTFNYGQGDWNGR